jgi:hypothetical protein
VLADAPGLYELPPGRLTNFRPATGVGRVRIEREGDALILTSRWGDWKHGVKMLPADEADPRCFVLTTEGVEPAYVILTRGADGHIDGLLRDRLVRMVKVR